MWKSYILSKNIQQCHAINSYFCSKKLPVYSFPFFLFSMPYERQFLVASPSEFWNMPEGEPYRPNRYLNYLTFRVCEYAAHVPDKERVFNYWRPTTCSRNLRWVPQHIALHCMERLGRVELRLNWIYAFAVFSWHEGQNFKNPKYALFSNMRVIILRSNWPRSLEFAANYFPVRQIFSESKLNSA